MTPLEVIPLEFHREI